MKTYTDIKNLPEKFQGAVVAIGNFDGVHKGHQKLLSIAKELAANEGRSFGVLTFEPHPRKLFRPDDPPFRITPVPVKYRRLELTGADFIVAQSFDWNFASQSAGDFVKNTLVDGLSAARVVVGEDFYFGQLRKGSSELLQDLMPSLIVTEQLLGDDQEAFSSSRIRAALRKGDIKKANEMLGWQWEIEGEVVHGAKRGRKLGYPTANVPLGETLHPGYGVYAAWIKIEKEVSEGEWLPAAANIGIRPMFEVPVGHAEAFIFDFNQDIYNRKLRIKPVTQIRGEAKFATIDELITQMKEDCDQVKEILRSSPPEED